jgi:putative aldouronate transport system permease protein
MYFSGGIIPYYLVVSGLGLRDNIWVFIIPSLYSSFNIILMRTFMVQLPESLNESARLDGAGDFIIFCRIILPLSMPVLATVALFTAVHHWNDWYTATVFTTGKKLWPASTLLLNILKSSEISSFISTKFFMVGGRKRIVTPEALKMAMLIVTTLPVVIVYPFLQKYFVKGVMIGSLKE